MPSYDWMNFQTYHWKERFPHWAVGVKEWAAQQGNAQGTIALLNTLQALPRTTKHKRPMLFVSHRQSDRDRAMRVAWLADQEGFDFWLDVLDPNLAILNSFHGVGSTSSSAIGNAIACVIEMGLLNSTHLLAVMTANTAGSQWVPYEYGRAKDKNLVSLETSCWADPKLTSKDPLPEYLHLGPISSSDSDVTKWLQSRFTVWKKANGSQLMPPAGNWNPSEPEPPSLE